MTAPESEYLDLDGDGVPDAVRTSRTMGYDVTGDGVADVVETIDEVASEIDDAGVPHHVEVTDVVEADVRHDGDLDVVDVASVEAARSGDLGAPRERGRRRRDAPRAVLTRVRRRMRRRGAAKGFAATRVSPDALIAALRHVTACSSPEGDVRVSIDRDVVGVSVHAPHAGWWAAAAVRARLRRGAPTALTVDRSDLVAALLAAATTHPRGVPLILQQGDALWAGDAEVPAITDVERVVSAPPQFETWEPLGGEIVVPTVDDPAGETAFPFARGTITTTNGFLRALAAWEVDQVAVFESAGRVFLLGSSTEQETLSRIIVTGEARIDYR